LDSKKRRFIEETFPVKEVGAESSMEKKELNIIIRTIKDLREQIRREYKAEIVGILGSYARGEEKESSDVDILVKFLDRGTLFDFVGLADFLEEKLHVKVDIVSERAVRPELKEQIFQEVIAV
jgi:predicted nucleotidyltransferase